MRAVYRAGITERFSAAHFLRGYHGKCENMHGHNYRIEIDVTAHQLDRIGIAVDFEELKEALRNQISKFDHVLLNELPEFRKENPSCENIARHIYLGMKKGLSGRVKLSRVKVWESDGSYISYPA